MSATTAVWSSRGSGLAAGRHRPWDGGIAFSQPQHGVEHQLVLRVAREGGRKLLAWLAGEIDIVMPHVEIDHAILDVDPHRGISIALPRQSAHLSAAQTIALRRIVRSEERRVG